MPPIDALRGIPRCALQELAIERVASSRLTAGRCVRLESSVQRFGRALA
jgi:hypothetical protein